MSPTLSQAYQRRWWIAVTSVVENLMFAAVLLGWSSLLLMLKNEGFYSHLCVVTNETTAEAGNGSVSAEISNTSTNLLLSSNETEKNPFPHLNTEEPAVRFTPSGKPTCAKQDELLNRYFSIGSSLLSGVTIILGVIMDKYGSRMIRLCGTWAFMLSCVMFAIGSIDPANYSILIAPGVCLNGMGGVVYIFTSFPVPNLFENLRSTMISLMIGSYSASAVMYMLFKTAYDAGVPFIAIMSFHAGVGFLTFLNCYFTTPGEPIPGPDDLSYAIKLRFGAFRFEHKISGKKFLDATSVVGRRMSSTETTPAENHNYLTSIVDLKGKDDSSNQEMSFLKVLCTPCILWSFVTMCLTQLRLIAYMGGLELYFRSSSHHKGFDEDKTTETVDFYAFLFGLLQINCFFMAPVIGTIMDWNLKPKKKSRSEKKKKSIVKLNHNGTTAVTELNNHDGNGNSILNGVNYQPKKSKRETAKATTENSKKLKRKRQQVTNLFRAFLLTNTLLLLFGIIVLFEDMIELQILAFFVHTAVRTFLHSSTGGLYACMYHFSHFGKLTGLASFLSAMFILIQDPLFVIINQYFGGDPFWINFSLLVLTLSGFGLPAYLWIYRKRLDADASKTDVEERQLFAIDEDEANEDDYSSSSDEEQAPCLSNVALAL